jgi:hypothetical protein
MMIAEAMAGVGIILLLIHIFITDRVGFIAQLFYLTPRPFLGALFLPLTLKWLFGRRYKEGAVLAILCLLPSILHYGTMIPGTKQVEDSVGHENNFQDNSIRVIFWAPDHYEFTTVDRGFEYLTRFNADIVLLVEGNVDHGRQRALAARLFPDHRLKLLPHGMLILHKGEVKESLYSTPGDRSGLNQLVLEQQGKVWRIALYDQDSNPFYSRKASLLELAYSLPVGGDAPKILAGDFNTPHYAHSFNPLKERYENTYSSAMMPHPYTWPSKLPVMAFDQVWYSGDLKLLQVRSESTEFARHRPVIADFIYPKKETGR